MNSSSSIEIRVAEVADTAAIASLLAASFADYFALYTPAGYAATAITAHEIASRMKEGPVWVALGDGLIVGTVSVVAQGESLYIRGMAVLPSARGTGIGVALLRQVEQFAANGSFKRLYLSTTPFLDRAIRLYEHFGFRRITAGPHDLFGTPLFTMEKVLNKQGSQKQQDSESKA